MTIAPTLAPPSLSLAVRRYTSLSELAPLRERIDALNERSPRPCPFSTFEFFENFVRNDELMREGEDAHVLMLAALEGERLVGYLPLRRSRQPVLGVRTHRIDWLVRHEGDRPHLVAAPEDEARCARAFLDHLLAMRGWSQLDFASQEASSVLHAAVSRVPRDAYYVRQFPANPTCSIPIEWTSFDAYFQALSRKRRASVRRYARMLCALGTLEWISSTDAASGEALFDSFLALERRSWKHGTAVPVERSPQRVAFYRGLFDPAQPLQSAVHLLTLDGVPIAGVISVRFADGVFSQEMVYDERMTRVGPGNLAHLLIMHDCIRTGARFYNLKAMFAYYKEAWLARVIETSTIQIFRRASLPHLKALAGEWRQRRRAVTESSPLDHNPDRGAAREQDPQEESHDDPTASSGLPAEALAARDRLARALASGIIVERLRDGEVRSLMPWLA